jgi:hypothetical protein
VVSRPPLSGVRMSDQGNKVPPCWAVDPSGRHRFRYWDGTAWTGHVADGEVPPTAPPGPPPAESLFQQLEPEEPERREPSQYVVGSERAQPADSTDRLETRQQRQPERGRGSFWIGVVVGALVTAALAAVAWVTLGEDNSSSTKVVTRATTTTSRRTTTTTIETSSTLETSTTIASASTRPPAQVRVEVLNASGTEGAAGSKSDALKAAGYTIAGLGNATVQQGTTVACKTGFDAEAAALAQAVGSGATTVPFPTTPPPGSTDADCVVTLGK